MPTLGEIIAKRRKDKSLTQQDLADFMGMKKNTYAHKEKHNTFNSEELDKISDFLGFSEHELTKTTKAPIIPDVDAFVVSQLTKQTAILAVLLELAAEQEARFSNQPVTKVLSDLDRAVSNKEEMLRAASSVKHGSS